MFNVAGPLEVGGIGAMMKRLVNQLLMEKWLHDVRVKNIANSVINVFGEGRSWMSIRHDLNWSDSNICSGYRPWSHPQGRVKNEVRF